MGENATLKLNYSGAAFMGCKHTKGKSDLQEKSQLSKYFLKFLHISAPNSILLCSVRSSKDSQDVCSAELCFERHFSLENSQSVSTGQGVGGTGGHLLRGQLDQVSAGEEVVRL